MYYFMITPTLSIATCTIRPTEISKNGIGGNGVQVKTANKKFIVMCSHSTHNLEFSHSMLFFCRDGEEIYQNL